MQSEITLLKTAQLAEMLGVTVRCLEKWRQLGRGPKWTMVGAHCRYRRSDVEEYLANGDGARREKAA